MVQEVQRIHTKEYLNAITSIILPWRTLIEVGLGMKGREGEDDSMRCERSNGSDINKDSETGREEVRG